MNLPYLKEEIDLFDCVFYRLNKKLLSLTGLWPYQSRLKSFFGYNIIQLTLLAALIPQFLGLWKARGDFDIIVEGLSPCIVALASFTLLKTWTLKKKKMQLLLEYMKADWKYWLKKSEIDILHRYAMTGRTLTIAYGTYIYSTTFTFVTLPMIPVIIDWVVPLNESRPKQSVYVAEYYIDQEKYLYRICALEAICGLTATSMIVNVETMFMVYTQHACGIFSMIGCKLQNLVTTENSYSESIYNHKATLQGNVDMEIKNCVGLHRKVIEFVECVKDCFSTGFFIIMGLNMMIISITGIQTVIKFGEPREVLRYSIFTAAQMFHLFFLCVPCQNLIDHSLAIRNQIYNSGWYKLPIRSQKMLLFMMIRSSNPCEFVAGVLFKLSIETFSSVLHKSMSYFTVLSSAR